MNKKYFYITITSLSIALFFVLWLVYPFTTQAVEGNSLFLTTNEYLKSILLHPVGGSRFISNFLYQFYYCSISGAIIYALIVCLNCIIAYNIFKKYAAEYSWMALLYLPLSVYIGAPLILSVISILFFLLFLYILLYIRNNWIRGICIIAFVPLLYLFVPLVGILLFYLNIGIILLLNKKKSNKKKPTKWICICCLIALLGTMTMPIIWNNYIEFVPYSERILGIFSDFEFMNLIGFLIPLLSVFLAFFLPHCKTYIKVSILLISYSLVFATFIFDKDLQITESYYKLSSLADNKQWQEIIDNISYEERQDPIKMRYAMLADQQLGTLGEHLFTYPIHSGDEFLFSHSTNPFHLNFNRQFYDCLNIPDECLHMAFEYGVLTENGLCMNTLRQMLDYTLRSGDMKAAGKYIYLLKHTTLMPFWLKEHQQEIDNLKKQKAKTEPYRTDTFIGGYPFNSEMVRVYEYDKSNNSALEYLLFGLLLQKEVDKVGLTMSYYPLYKSETAPKVIAEAATMLSLKNPGIRKICNYDPIFDSKFADFCQKMKNQQDVSEYQDTFWFYFFYKNTTEPSEASE